MKPPTIDVNSHWFDAIGGKKALINLDIIKRTKGEFYLPGGFSKQERRVFRKRKKISPSSWAEKHRVLPESARYKGLWRNDTFAYLSGILDASFEKSVAEIGICAAPQTGKTEGIYTCLGYAADMLPGNAMILFPSETDAKDNSKDRIAPMFHDSPRLKDYMTGYADDMGSIKMTLTHMVIYMAWANSPGRLSNRPARYAYADEIDKYPETSGKRETSPLNLLRLRLRTYNKLSKLWVSSSPTIETGPIWEFIEKECHCQFRFYAKCPLCGHEQRMVFGDRESEGGIRWPKEIRTANEMEITQSAWYQCAHCDAKWDDATRDMAVRAGRWKEQETGIEMMTYIRTEKPMRIGFHVPAWISPLVPMWKCASAFLKGTKDKTALKDFQNGFAAEPWRATESERATQTIMDLADERPVGRVPGNGQTACLLAGVDTQDDGFWFEIRAVGYGLESWDSWGVRCGFLQSFDDLAQALWHDQYTDADGNAYPVRLVLQDAMGHRTGEVYQFCMGHRGLILPTQGRQHQNVPVAFTTLEYMPPDAKGRRIPIHGGLQLTKVDTNYFKNLLDAKLKIKRDDPGAWRYHVDISIEWAKQMVAEGIDEKGNWVPITSTRANHGWDCSVLIMAAREVLGVKFWPAPVQDEAKNENVVKKKDNNKSTKARMW